MDRLAVVHDEDDDLQGDRDDLLEQVPTARDPAALPAPPPVAPDTVPTVPPPTEVEAPDDERLLTSLSSSPRGTLTSTPRSTGEPVESRCPRRGRGP